MVPEPDELTKVSGGWLTPDKTVNVTDDDIQHGLQRDQWGCAIVRAIQRQNPTAIRVRVNAKFIGFTIGEIRYTFPTPQPAIDGIIRPFDQGEAEKVQPMHLRLTGGRMKDVIHADDRVLQEIRSRDRDRKERIGKSGHNSDRQRQMSPNWHEYERF